MKMIVMMLLMMIMICLLDCWSFGVVLYQLLTLERPFNGSSTGTCIVLIVIVCFSSTLNSAHYYHHSHIILLTWTQLISIIIITIIIIIINSGSSKSSAYEGASFVTRSVSHQQSHSSSLLHSSTSIWLAHYSEEIKLICKELLRKNPDER